MLNLVTFVMVILSEISEKINKSIKYIAAFILQLLVMTSIYLCESMLHAIAVIVSLSVLLIFFSIYKFKKKIKYGANDSIWFILSIGLITIFFFENSKWIILFSTVPVIIASLFYKIGESLTGTKKILIARELISPVGLFSYFFSSALTLIIGKIIHIEFIFPVKVFAGDLTAYYFFVFVLISATITLFMMLSSGGFDFFINPIINSALAFIFLNEINYSLLESYFLGIFFAGLIAVFSYKVKFLTLNGSIATFLLAGFIFGLGGIQWSVPMLTFFILSSILSKLRKNVNSDVESYFEKTGVRDYMQVMANGGLGGILVIINAVFPGELNYVLYVSTLSAVCADTWATEIGTWRKTTTYNILNFKPAPQGISGGISLRGTFGAFMGAIAISIAGVWWINFNIVSYFFLVIFAGVFGSFVDSFLGATVQAQNKCGVCSKITEKEIHCGVKSDFYKGYKWINNDFVNLFSGIAGALFIILINFLLS